jgi:hypothetical protein
VRTKNKKENANIRAEAEESDDNLAESLRRRGKHLKKEQR